MLAFQFYLWLLYLAAGLGLLVFCWRGARRLRSRFFRDALLGLPSLVLFIPWFAHPEQPALAPAVIIALHEWLFPEAVGEWRATKLLLLSYGGFLLVLSVSHWLTRRWHSSAEPVSSAKESNEAATAPPTSSS